MELQDQNTGETVARDHSTISSLGANASRTVTLSWDTSRSAVGDHDLAVATNDDSETGEVTVEPSLTALDIEIVDTDEPVTGGETLTVTTVIENSGTDRVDDAHVVLTDAGTGTEVDIRFDVSIGPGDTEVVTLAWDTRRGDGNDETDRTVRAEIANTNERDTESVSIEEADGSLDQPTIGTPGNPLEIELEEIEIDS